MAATDEEDTSLPVYPAVPDDRVIASYLAEMPGGRYIGEQWRAEPRVLVAVDLLDGPTPVIAAAASAYPPYPGPGYQPSTTGNERGPLLFAVPQTVAEAIEWNRAAEDVAVEVLGAGDTHWFAAEVIAPLVARLWTVYPYFEGSILAALDRFLLAAAAAARTGHDLAVVCDMAATFWRDGNDPDRDFAEYITAALALLTSG
jgi:hypothetical protein